MNNLPKNAKQLREVLAGIKFWAVPAGVCLAVLLSLYTFQGVQYWNAWQDARTMNAEIDRISLKLDRPVPDATVAAHQLDAHQSRLDYLKSLYHYPDAARLAGIVSNASWDAGVDLPSISAADPTFRDMDGMTYRVQILSVNARGELHNIYRFLAEVQQTVPVVSVTNMSISNPTSEEASAQVQLTFYATPRPTTDSNGAD